MNVGKSNLVAMLLEVGEENAAVLLARSDWTAIRWTKSRS
jgi:hypothetical protein